MDSSTEHSEEHKIASFENQPVPSCEEEDSSSLTEQHIAEYLFDFLSEQGNLAKLEHLLSGKVAEFSRLNSDFEKNKLDFGRTLKRKDLYATLEEVASRVNDFLSVSSVDLPSVQYYSLLDLRLPENREQLVLYLKSAFGVTAASYAIHHAFAGDAAFPYLLLAGGLLGKSVSWIKRALSIKESL
ncbi:hypothetical protein D6764_04640, partial [Candidatus Woesearchaeota archaeon]